MALLVLFASFTPQSVTATTDFMDDGGFAQSRGDDDLFDDELIPIEPEEVQQITEKLEDVAIQPEVLQPSRTRGSGGRGGPGRSRGSGRGGRNRGSSTAMPFTKSQDATRTDKEGTDSMPTPDAGEPGAKEAEIEAEPQPAKPQAVRGDRTATGGIKKPKLTEEELNAKMAEAKARSSTVAEAHARALADAASFEERERVAQEKRNAMQAKDAVNRKVMDNEREANRRRKMQAQGIREWDMEKNEEDFAGRGRGRNFMRGAHGGVRYDRSNNADQEPLDEYQQDSPFEGRVSGRGRGKRRGRGGRANGQEWDSGISNGLADSKFASPNFKVHSEFPALPPSLKPQGESTKKPERPIQTGRKVSDVLSGNTESGTWAEQVESSVEAK
ncbi:hypothetical protein UCRPC4_g02494 [Phaeomoniella chlamydospora]|uniref:Uncharacterized protein n=1 Tax=Phaeomoniella chlamydospora TaxID=158046 RepID=A0A0G2EQ38_PHACM|nr:hypothetical protein UCRPC4_g02494 [Phaeomoniella chlamydospora]